MKEEFWKIRSVPKDEQIGVHLWAYYRSDFIFLLCLYYIISPASLFKFTSYTCAKFLLNLLALLSQPQK